MSVQNLTFEHPDAEDLPPATLGDKARKELNDYSSEVRYGVLLLLFLIVYLLMIRPIQKRVLAIPNSLPAPAHAALAAESGLMPIQDSPAILAQRSIILKKQLADFVRAEPDSSVTAVRTWLQEETQ